MDGARAKITDTILFSSILGFASGIISDAFFFQKAPAPMLLAYAGAFALLVLGASLSLSFFPQKLKRPVAKFRLPLIGAGVFIIAALLGGWRMQAAKPDLSYLADKIDQKVTLRGIIDAPEFRSGGIQFTLDTGNAGVIISTKDYQTLAYGDEVEVTGKLRKPDNFTTDQGTEFDYVSYLYKDDILYRMSYAKVKVLSHGHGSWLVAKLGPVEDWFLQGFNRVLSVRGADLEGGLVLGSKENIDPGFRDALVTTGTIHIIALSGYNVTVVANALRALFTDVLGLGTLVASGAGALCIIFFVVMTGLQSSAIRAGIMALIGLFACGKGRTYDAFRALVVAGFLMILYDPKYLPYDVSFQLSFLATLGIIFLVPILERSFARVPKKILWIILLREAMAVTLGANLGVLPFILFKMGTLSIISLPANVLVLPAVPIAMATGTAAGVIGSFSTTLAYPFAFVTEALLNYITKTVVFFSKIPYASVIIKHFPLWLCLAMYVGLIVWVYRAWNKIERSKN